MSVEHPSGDDVADPAEDGPELPPIPDALLAPLLESAGEALRRLPPAELPAAARRLRSFDRRGLATPAARHQLRTLLEENEAVLGATAAIFAARVEVAPLTEAWTAAIAAGGDAPLTMVREAAAEGRLALLASVLIAALPDSFEFGLGLIVAMAANAEREDEVTALSREATAGQRAAEEAARRADAARATAAGEIARLEAELRGERQARRDRDQLAADVAAGAKARGAELESALAQTKEQLVTAERQAAAAAQRAADAERRVTDAERRVADAEGRVTDAERRADAAERRAAGSGRVDDARSGRVASDDAGSGRVHDAGPGRVDDAALRQIADAAEDLAAGLRRLADEARPLPTPPPVSPKPSPPPVPQKPSPAARPSPPARPAAAARLSPSRKTAGRDRRAGPRRRAPVRLPPGMLQDDPAAIEAMIRTPGLAVIVDGYNVSMLAWPGASVADQRERLCDALVEFQLRFRCEVTVVFDGAEVPGVRPLRRRNLRIVFSAAGQEADEVVVGEVMFRPDEVPVIVVSSDREVRAGARAEGAMALEADELLQLMRR